MRDFNGLKIPFGVVTIKMADTHFDDFLSKEATICFIFKWVNLLEKD
jgi:hypothetical protein